MLGILVREISVSKVKKINHGLPLCKNNVNGVYKCYHVIFKRINVKSPLNIFFVRHCYTQTRQINYYYFVVPNILSLFHVKENKNVQENDGNLHT
jgi:hypothetical protein